MSALVWSVESAVLGAWALVLSFYSTPFHAFIARSHSIIAGCTLLLQLVAVARDLPIGHAIAEAFVCAVSALLLVYVAALLDTSNHARFFSMPATGMLVPLDAAIGIAWFCAAGVSATGMALSGVGKPLAEDGSKRRASLMFHQYGYHMSIVLPSLLILWLYNYDADNKHDPVYKGVKLVRNNLSIGHTVLFVVYAGIWGVFVVAQFLGEGVLTGGKQWTAWSGMSAGDTVRYVFAALFKFIGRGGCVLLPLSAVFASKTNAQMILAWTLVGVASANAVDLMSLFDRLTGQVSGRPTQSGTFLVKVDVMVGSVVEKRVLTLVVSALPANAVDLMSVFDRLTGKARNEEEEEEDNFDPSAPPMEANFGAPTAPATLLYRDTPTTQQLPDPAAVALSTASGGSRQSLPLPKYQPLISQARRDKMV